MEEGSADEMVLHAPTSNYTTDIPENLTEGVSYEIDKIVDAKKDKNGKMMYQARFVAHTWMSEEYMLLFPNLIKQYWNEKQQKEENNISETTVYTLLNPFTKDATGNILADVEHSAKTFSENDELDLICEKCERKFFLKSNHEVHVLFCKGKEEAVVEEKNSEVNTIESAEKDTSHLFTYEYQPLPLNVESTCVTCLGRHQNILESTNIGDLSGVMVNYHVKMVSDEVEVYECNECNRDFLYKHPASTSQEAITVSAVVKKELQKPFKCCICSRCFQTKNEMLEHEVKHVNTASRYTCATCNRKFVIKDELQKHYDAKDNQCMPRKCDLCGRVFIHANHLKRHMSIHAGVKPYRCSVCKHEFNQRSDMQRHEKRHTTDDGHFVCNKCTITFEDANRLKEHIDTHKGTSDESFECKICLKVFKRKSHYKRHMSVHEGLKPHACDQCGKSFNQRTDLKRHKLSHVKRQVKLYGERGAQTPKCEICNKTFSTQSKFVEHYVTHKKIAVY